jgi:hypothetical protein
MRCVLVLLVGLAAIGGTLAVARGKAVQGEWPSMGPSVQCGPLAAEVGSSAAQAGKGRGWGKEHPEGEKRCPLAGGGYATGGARRCKLGRIHRCDGKTGEWIDEHRHCRPTLHDGAQ